MVYQPAVAQQAFHVLVEWASGVDMQPSVVAIGQITGFPSPPSPSSVTLLPLLETTLASEVSSVTLPPLSEPTLAEEASYVSTSSPAIQTAPDVLFSSVISSAPALVLESTAPVTSQLTFTTASTSTSALE